MNPLPDDPPLEIEIIERPAAPALAELASYWERKRVGRIAPRRSDIDPSEIRQLLPHISLLDVVDGGADFRFRLIGTAIVQGTGRDSTGKLLSELYDRRGAVFEKFRRLWAKVAVERRPIFARGTTFWLPADEKRHFASAYLPLSEDGATVNIVMAGVLIFWPGADPSA